MEENKTIEGNVDNKVNEFNNIEIQPIIEDANIDIKKESESNELKIKSDDKKDDNNMINENQEMKEIAIIEKDMKNQKIPEEDIKNLILSFVVSKMVLIK